MKDKELLDRYRELRNKNIDLIAVANSEWYSLFRDEIRNSIAIEGIFANRNELLDVLAKNKRTTDQKTAAILGYFEAAGTVYEYANNLYKEGEFTLRVSDIKQIHTLLLRYEKQVGSFNGELGEFRTGSVEVNEATFTPLDYKYVREVMDLFVKWINQKLRDQEYDKLKLAVLSHILFETIHPFKDGNGRAGRILLSFILIGCGYVNIAIKGTQKIDRNKYYDAMENGDDEFERMLRQIEDGIKIKTDQFDSYANKSSINLLYEIVINRLEDSYKRLNKDNFVVMNTDAIVPLRDAAKYFNYSQDYLRNLINKGKLPAEKKGKLWYLKIRDVDQYIKSFSSEEKQK